MVGSTGLLDCCLRAAAPAVWLPVVSVARRA